MVRCSDKDRGYDDLFFFFSSRRRHTRCGRDWSSDVCSSDLGMAMIEGGGPGENVAAALEAPSIDEVTDPVGRTFRAFADQTRSEERRVGKECRSRWSPDHCKKKIESI